jgi:lipopolysaccharide export system protein LptA
MTRSTAGWAVMTAALLTALATVPARGQILTGSKDPIDISGDQAEVVQSKCMATWRGSAEALQGDARLRANTITVFYAAKGVGSDGHPACGGTERIVADGDVYYVTAQQHARGDHAVYTTGADLIVMTGDVIVVQGNDVVRGDKLTIKVSDKVATMESTVTGAGKPGRVRAVVYPDKKDDAAADTKPAAPPKS